MNKITIMEAAVRKWNRIIAGKGSDGGVWDCPPCRLFYLLFCVGCPIASYTGRKFCKGSPYGPWYHHQNDAHGYLIRKVRCPECIDLATQMRDYMQEILDHLKAQKAAKEVEIGEKLAPEPDGDDHR